MLFNKANIKESRFNGIGFYFFIQNSVKIKVGNHTQLDGAEIANIKEDGSDGGNLSLDTKTFSYTDLKDHDKEKSTYLSLGFSSGGSPGANSQTGASKDKSGKSFTASGNYSNVNQEQITRATFRRCGTSCSEQQFSQLSREVRNEFEQAAWINSCQQSGNKNCNALDYVNEMARLSNEAAQERVKRQDEEDRSKRQEEIAACAHEMGMSGCRSPGQAQLEVAHADAVDMIQTTETVVDVGAQVVNPVYGFYALYQTAEESWNFVKEHSTEIGALVGTAAVAACVANKQSCKQILADANKYISEGKGGGASTTTKLNGNASDLSPGVRAEGDFGVKSSAAAFVDLRFYEVNGSHLISMHVNKSAEELVARANGKNGFRAPAGGASSYSSLDAAEFYTAEILKQRDNEIKLYLSAPNAPTKSFDIEFNQGTGVWVPKGGNNTQTVTAARVVIKPDANMPSGYRIITGHPIPSSAVKN